MKNKNIKMIVGAVAGVLLIAGVMFFVFKDNGSDQVAEAPVIEEQVVEENTNQFAQDIIMRAESEAEVVEEEPEVEEKVEEIAEAEVEEETKEEQTSIVASEDVDSSEEEASGGTVVISSDASPKEIAEIVKEKVAQNAQKQEQTTSQPAVYTAPDGKTYNSPEELAAALGGSVGFDDLEELPAGGVTESHSGIQFE